MTLNQTHVTVSQMQQLSMDRIIFDRTMSKSYLIGFFQEIEDYSNKPYAVICFCF